MELIISDTNSLSDVDRAVLRALLGSPETAPSQPDSAPTAKAKAKAPTKTAPEKPVETAPEPGEEEAATETGGATMEEAVALATKLVSKGEAAKVKAALSEVGAKRVSEITPDSVQAFVDHLS